MRGVFVVVFLICCVCALASEVLVENDSKSSVLIERYMELASQLQQIQKSDERQEVLFALGNVAMSLRVWTFSDEVSVSFVKQHPEAFEYDEVGAGWLYTGVHFKTLFETFPSSPLADDAAYAKTLLLQKGECEGNVDCMLEGATREPLWFIQHYPVSPLVTDAQQRIRHTLEWLLDRDAEKPIRADHELAAYVKRLLDKVSASQQQLPLPNRTAFDDLLDKLRNRL